MKKIATTLAVLGLFATAGCSSLDTTEQRVLTGGAIGTGVGVLVGVASGGISIAAGALIGAATGAAGGFAYDQWIADDQAAQ